MTHFSTILFALAAVAFLQISAFEIVQDVRGASYYLVPVDGQHVRQRRDTKQGWERENLYDISNKHAGLGQKLTFENDRHKFSGSATAERDFKPKGPLTTSQTAEYLYKPNGSNLQLESSNTRGSGTDFSAKGTYNFFQTQDKRGRVGVGGEYSRHYGGLGTTDPKYGVFVKGSYDF